MGTCVDGGLLFQSASGFYATLLPNAKRNVVTVVVFKNHPLSFLNTIFDNFWLNFI